jgi:hypothetical protein
LCLSNWADGDAKAGIVGLELNAQKIHIRE